MTNSVKIVKNSKNGLVFTPGTKVSNNGKSYGFYVVEQSTITEEGGFIREEKRSALLTAENTLGAKLNYPEGHEKSGKIIREESFTPYFTGQEPVINPQTKVPVLRQGKQIYRQDLFAADLSKTDKLIPREAVSADVAVAVEAGSGLAN